LLILIPHDDGSTAKVEWRVWLVVAVRERYRFFSYGDCMLIL